MSRIGRHAWSRFLTLTLPYFRSDQRWRAFGLMALLIGLVLTLTGLNAVNSYVFGGSFMTAIQQQDSASFQFYGLLSVAVFGLLTVAAVSKTYVEQRFALMWRKWLTGYLTNRYLAGRAYYHIQEGEGIDNPDQRIAEDVRTFTETSLSLGLILLNAALTLFTFSGILWSITPWLLLAAVLYAGFGSVLTVLLGRRLVGLNVERLRQEADLRCALIHVRENAEPIALLGGEVPEQARVHGRLHVLVSNLKRIIGVNRNLGFFTIGYNSLIPVIPVLIVAPLFIAGEVEFGTVTQAPIVFGFVLGAFSLIITEFQRLSGFAADIERLGSLWEALREAHAPRPTGVVLVEEGDHIAFEGVTLLTPRGARPLMRDLWVDVPEGQRLLITGPQGSGRSALLRAAAGLWRHGEGRIIRPDRQEVLFLPQKPFLTPGTLRDQLVYGARQAVSERRLHAVLAEVGLEAVLQRAGGLDVECDWPNLLSLGDQQLVAGARLLLVQPRFAFLDEATSALDQDRGRRLYEALARRAITYVSTATDTSLGEYHDLQLKLHGDGTWKLLIAEDAVIGGRASLPATEPAPACAQLPATGATLFAEASGEHSGKIRLLPVPAA